VVYDLGQELYYYEQFYDPYRNYNAPIIAIPGNHDGMVSPSVKQSTLQGFTENFCTQTPSKNPEAQGFARTTMVQPGVYFTLNAPFVDFIGLYSNIGDGTVQGTISGGVVGTAQLTFLQQQLTAIAASRKAGKRNALVIAVHHPPFTGSADHSPSPAMLQDIDTACTAAGIQPDMVLSGHSHLYERYTRTIGGAQIPFVVAGMGGYWNLSGIKTDQNNQPPVTPFHGTDMDGNPLVLETYNAKTFGYMKMKVSAASVACTVYGVTPSAGGQAAAVSVLDSFTLDLVKHTVS
jgi:3',5'-cyclic AMP phosphodiesterase CpdA